MGARGSLFSAATQKTPKPLTAPKEDKVLRTGTKNIRRFCEMATWGCSIICKNLVPFHDHWIDGDETEKRPSYPLSEVTEFAQNNENNFWDTTRKGNYSSFIVLA